MRIQLWRLTIGMYIKKRKSALLPQRTLAISFTWETRKWVAARKRIRAAVAKAKIKEDREAKTIETIERIKDNCDRITKIGNRFRNR
jgi:hypothetical protein